MDDRGHHPALEGVRGVAILLVLGQHAPTKPLANGYVGVTVFFCLSGFLITTLLLRELRGGTVDLPGFYRRRVVRLGPGLATVVAVTTVLLFVDRPDLGVRNVLVPAGTAVVYGTSLYDWTGHLFATYDYFNYTWSLSIEEQFYLLWPVALLWGHRRNPRLFAALTGALIAIALALNLYLGLSRSVKFDPHEYYGSDVNALPVLVGCLLALVVHHDWLRGSMRRLAPGALLALTLLVVLAHRSDVDCTSLVRVAGTALTLVLLVGVVVTPRSAVGLALASAPMRWLGQRSYSIYLWNVLARITVLYVLGHSALGDLAWVVLVVVLAETGYQLVERPLRARFAGRPVVPRHPLPEASVASVPRLS